MKPIRCFLIIIMLLPVDLIFSQNDPYFKGDTLKLMVPTTAAWVQWQISTDLSDWSNLENETSDSLLMIAEDSVYIRSEFSLEGCETQYSDTAQITVRDWPLLFIVINNIECYRIDNEGNLLQFIENAKNLGKRDNHLLLYGKNTIDIYDTNGIWVNTYHAPATLYAQNYVMLDTCYAMLNELTDSIYLVGFEGTIVKEIPLPNASPNLQNMSGVVVNDTLVVCENGNKQLIGYDLNNGGDAFIFRDFSSAGIDKMSSILYKDGYFYLGGDYHIRRFTRYGELETVCSVDDSNITSMRIIGNETLLATVNFGNCIYRVNLKTGHFAKIIEGLAKPVSLECF